MRKITLFSLILLLASFLRFYGIDWDQGHCLHPDERFLIMVNNDTKVPSSFADYLNPQVSTLNPYNINHSFFVYGTFPLNLNKYIASVLNIDQFDNLRIMGRALSALFDIGTLIIVFLIVQLLEPTYQLPKYLKYLASFFYSIAVLPIQQSHFFTVDCFQVCAVFLSLYFALASYYHVSLIYILLSGVAFGVGLGCKITAIYILPIVMPLICLSRFISIRNIFSDTKNVIKKSVVFVLTSYLALRFADPKFFADANFLHPLLNPIFLKNIKELNALSSPSDWPFPPSIQWLSSTPFWSPFKNLILYGVGLPYAILFFLGVALVFIRRWYLLCCAVLWVLLIFLFQGGRFVHSMRYFFVLFPFFAIFASIGFSAILQRRALATLILILTLIWPISFMSIYKYKHSRVRASEWIYANLEDRAVIATEHWDDGLPLSIPEQQKTFTSVQLPVFAPDNEQKWSEMNQALLQANYIIFSSNRGYGSLMPQKKKIPRTVKWYEDLFAGKSNFLLIKEFTSSPQIKIGSWKFEFNTQKAEEAFSVYDHPKVSIFKKKN